MDLDRKMFHTNIDCIDFALHGRLRNKSVSFSGNTYLQLLGIILDLIHNLIYIAKSMQKVF